jgi:hypothetical protein
MPGGGQRDEEFERQLKQAEQQARDGNIDRQQVATWLGTNRKGDRILALGAMKGNPELRDPQLVLHTIGNPHGGFDQDRFLVLAAEMLPDLNEDERHELRRVIERQRRSGPITPQRIRWLTSERILRLLDR